MFSNTIARTLATLGFPVRPPANEDVDLRAAMAAAEGEMPTLVAPPTRIPPHMRHLNLGQDDVLRGYSTQTHRPAASIVPIAEKLVAGKPANAR